MGKGWIHYFVSTVRHGDIVGQSGISSLDRAIGLWKGKLNSKTFSKAWVQYVKVGFIICAMKYKIQESNPSYWSLAWQFTHQLCWVLEDMSREETCAMPCSPKIHLHTHIVPSEKELSSLEMDSKQILYISKCNIFTVFLYTVRFIWLQFYWD